MTARPVPERGIDYLRRWLPDTHEPDFRAWMLSSLSDYAALRGEAESAVALSGEACQVAQASANPSELLMRRVDRARLLLGVNRPYDALNALCIAEEATPMHRANIALLRVRVYLECGERSVAHDWLQRAEQAIVEGNQDSLLPEASALALRF